MIISLTQLKTQCFCSKDLLYLSKYTHAYIYSDVMQTGVMLDEELGLVCRLAVVVYLYRKPDLLFLTQGQCVRVASFG